MIAQAFFRKGENVTIEWFINGQSKGAYQRLCKSNDIYFENSLYEIPPFCML